MRTPISILLSALLVATLAGCSDKKKSPTPAKGPGDGGGGVDVVFDFQKAALNAFEDIPRYPKLKEIPVEELKAELKQAKIYVTDEPLTVVEGTSKQDVVAKNDPRLKTITINGPKWLAIKSSVKKESLALHELLSLKGIENNGNYRLSQLYYELASPEVPAQYRDIVKQQTLNDLEMPRIKIVVFADMISAFYAKGALELNQVLEEYGDRVQVIVRNFPISVLHEQAKMAALAGICAAPQGKFRELHDAIVNKIWNGPGGGFAAPDIAPVIAEVRAKMDTQAFDTCLESPAAQMRLDHDMALVEDFKVMGSPNYIVSSKWQSQRVEGLRTAAQWKEILEAMLNYDPFK